VSLLRALRRGSGMPQTGAPDESRAAMNNPYYKSVVRIADFFLSLP
jgi:hypothetical protein